MSPEPVRILVIEDNRDNMTLLDYLLRAHGYSPRLTRSGDEGVPIALEWRPHLVLLDIRMPGMDGYDVVAALNSETCLKETRVVAVTASAMVGDRERIAAAGFDGYIQKPIEAEAFISEVERFLPAELVNQGATKAAK